MMTRRLEISALLAVTCVAALPRVVLAQGAAPGAPPPGAAPPAEAPKGPERPAGEKPPEAEAKPDAAPPPEPPPAPAPAPAAPAPEVKAAPAASAAASRPDGDVLPKAGYVPGYRTFVGVGSSPYMPRAGTLPGGFTPSFGAPTPSDDWSFNFTGFMSASVRASINERDNPGEGQSTVVLHAAPTTIDSYQSFNDTGATPGNWVGMLFAYGNRYVTATVSFDTYNPTRGTNYRSIGSQYFINDTFLSFRAPRLDRLQLAWNVGFFTQNYGRLGEYGGGLYNPPLIGTTGGAGESLTAEYDLTDTLTLIVEDGFNGSTKTGKTPQGVVNSAASNFSDSALPPAFTHHLHVGIRRKSDITIQVMAHAMSNFTLSDQVPPRPQGDNMDTRQWDESNPRDGSIHVFGLEGRAISQSYGYLALGAAYIKADNAYRVRGLTTYAQDGTRITQDWLGETTGGTGSIWAAAINYKFSLGAILRAPTPFWNDAPDVQGEASYQISGTQSDDEFFDGRLKQKVGLDALYTFLPWLGVGVRGDRIAPNSKDSEETFYALATRLQFRSNWTSHETITLKYVKWFYGDRTHGDGWDARPREQLDDQMVGLGFGMWW